MATEAEGLAGLRVLVAVACADGKLSVEERASLESALKDRGIDAPIDALIDDVMDLDTALAAVESQDVRKQIYIAAAGMALADGTVAEEEESVLARIREAWSLGDDASREAARLAAFATAPSTGSEISLQRLELDVARREAQRATREAAILAACVGAAPIPFVAEVVQLLLQNRLMDQILSFYGKDLTVKERAAVTGAALGLGFARFGLGGLMKLVPVWGSVFGIATGYVTTWGFGTALWRSIESNTLDASGLKKAFKEARSEGKAYYEEHKDEIAVEAKEREADAQRLTEKVADESSTPEDVGKELAK